MKKAIVLTMAIMLMLNMSSAVLADVTVVSPVVEYETQDAMLEATQIPMTVVAEALPDLAEDVTYASIDGDPFIVQIEFTVEGRHYTYRGALAESAEAAADVKEKMHGVYFTGETETGSGTFEEEGIDYEYTIDEEEAMLYTWYCPDEGTQYSLFSADAYEAGDGEMVFIVQVLVEDRPRG